MRHEYSIRKGGMPSTMAGQEAMTATRIHELEIVTDGNGRHTYAYTWTDDATGIKIKTNLTSKDCNRRDEKEGVVYFKSDKALWGWAMRVQDAQRRGLTA